MAEPSSIDAQALATLFAATALLDGQHLRVAYSEQHQCVGVWNAKLRRWQIVSGKALTGEWVQMPYELLIDGQPPVEPDDWKEV